MSRGELLQLFIILVYVQPWCASAQRYLLDPSAFITVSRGHNNNNLPLLQDVSDRLSFLLLMSNAARGKHLWDMDESFKRLDKQNGRYTPDEDMDGSDGIPSGVWRPRVSLVQYDTRLGNSDVGQFMDKRRTRNCNTSRITLQTLIEYLRTGKICGRRVAHVRFGLGGRRR